MSHCIGDTAVSIYVVMIGSLSKPISFEVWGNMGRFGWPPARCRITESVHGVVALLTSWRVLVLCPMARVSLNPMPRPTRPYKCLETSTALTSEKNKYGKKSIRCCIPDFTIWMRNRFPVRAQQ